MIKFVLFSYLLNRVFVSLANGQIVVFRRQFQANSLSDLDKTTKLSMDIDMDEIETTVSSTNALGNQSSSNIQFVKNPLLECLTGAWNFTEACLITCGRPQCPIKATIAIPPVQSIWCAYRNRILVIHAITLQLIDWLVCLFS